uniref:Uncharacterized protein n=1 Tax=Ixodes ricinus TaxID=34613 RepID=A0A6B0V4Q8_IXORI
MPGTRRVGLAGPVCAPVGVAAFLDDAKVLAVFASDQVREAALATLRVGRAGDDVLRRKYLLHPVLGGDAESGLEHGHGGEAVAAPAGLLVPNRGHVVNAAHVPPVELFGQGLGLSPLFFGHLGSTRTPQMLVAMSSAEHHHFVQCLLLELWVNLGLPGVLRCVDELREHFGVVGVPGGAELFMSANLKRLLSQTIILATLEAGPVVTEDVV